MAARFFICPKCGHRLIKSDRLLVLSQAHETAGSQVFLTSALAPVRCLGCGTDIPADRIIAGDYDVRPVSPAMSLAGFRKAFSGSGSVAGGLFFLLFFVAVMLDGITKTFDIAGNYTELFAAFAVLVALLVALARRAAIGPRQAGKAPARPAFADVWQALVRLCNHISGTAVVSIFLLIFSMPFFFAFADEYRHAEPSVKIPMQVGLALLCDIVFCVFLAALVWRLIYRRWSR